MKQKLDLQPTPHRWFHCFNEQLPTIYVLGEYLQLGTARQYRATILCGQPDGSFKRYGLLSDPLNDLRDVGIVNTRVERLVAKLIAEDKAERSLFPDGTTTAAMAEPSIVFTNPG